MVLSLLKATDKGSEVLERRKGWRQHRAAMRGRLLGANQMRDKGMSKAGLWEERHVHTATTAMFKWTTSEDLLDSTRNSA